MGPNRCNRANSEKSSLTSRAYMYVLQSTYMQSTTTYSVQNTEYVVRKDDAHTDSLILLERRSPRPARAVPHKACFSYANTTPYILRIP